MCVFSDCRMQARPAPIFVPRGKGRPLRPVYVSKYYIEKMSATYRLSGRTVEQLSICVERGSVDKSGDNV